MFIDRTPRGTLDCLETTKAELLVEVEFAYGMAAPKRFPFVDVDLDIDTNGSELLMRLIPCSISKFAIISLQVLHIASTCECPY